MPKPQKPKSTRHQRHIDLQLLEELSYTSYSQIWPRFIHSTSTHWSLSLWSSTELSIRSPKAWSKEKVRCTQLMLKGTLSSRKSKKLRELGRANCQVKFSPINSQYQENLLRKRNKSLRTFQVNSPDSRVNLKKLKNQSLLSNCRKRRSRLKRKSKPKTSNKEMKSKNPCHLDL